MRRRTICFAAALTTAAVFTRPGTALSASGPHPRGSELAPRYLRLRHAATDARFAGTYHNGIGPDASAMRDLSKVLADSRTGAVRAFDHKAIDILWELGIRERIEEFIVLSGYRTPVTNWLVEGAAGSQHLRAAALDLEIPAARLAAFGEAALALGRGGVGIYSKRGFVHIDSGPVRRWGDAVSGGRVRAIRRRDPLATMADAWAKTRTR